VRRSEFRNLLSNASLYDAFDKRVTGQDTLHWHLGRQGSLICKQRHEMLENGSFRYRGIHNVVFTYPAAQTLHPALRCMSLCPGAPESILNTSFKLSMTRRASFRFGREVRELHNLRLYYVSADVCILVERHSCTHLLSRTERLPMPT
jgi:hypothetical protein